MRPAGGTVLLQSESYYGMGKLGLAPTSGAHKHHQPSSSAESSESPRTGLCQPASTFNMPLDPAGMLAAPAATDPTTSVMAIKRGLSHLAPSQLAELQSMLRQQRLQRQQQDLLPLLQPVAAAAAPPPEPAVQSLLAGQDFAAGATEAAANAVSIMRQVASAASALANSSFAHEEAARVAFLQAAAAHLLMQHQQQYGVLAPAAATGVPAVPEQPQQQQLAAWLQQQPQHPGVTSCKAARNTVRRCRRYSDRLCDVLYDAPAMQQQQQDAWQTMADAADCGLAAAAPSSYGAAPQFAMAPAVRAALLQQLQQLEEAEQQQGARRSSGKAAAAGSQRKSARARKSAKRNWDATNNTSQQQHYVQDTDSGSRGSPGPASPHAAAAPARAGSADANNSSASGLSGFAATADAAAAAVQQQQRLIVKRVRFALADDEVLESEENQSASDDAEQPRHVIVRRIGPRAQARKRMHKGSARRRRPQRAPLC